MRKSLDYNICVLFLAVITFWIISLVKGYEGYYRVTTKPPPPAFLSTQTNVTVGRGQTAILQCAIQNIGTKTVVWRRASDPNPITIGPMTYVGDKRFRLVHDKYSVEWNLKIVNTTLLDSGVYECQVSSRSRSIRQLVLLNVEDRPVDPGLTSDIRIAGTSFIEKGNRLHLTCNATGDDYRPDAIDWFKDGIKMSSFDIRRRISIDVSLVDKTIISQLKIRRTVMSDSGTYVCRTSDQQITSLKVNILNTETNNEKRDMFVKDKITGSETPDSCATIKTAPWTFVIAAVLTCILFITR